MLTTRTMLRQIQQALQELNAKADIIMATQDDINAEAQQIEADVAAENTALSAIQAEIAALEAANPAIDLTGLKAAVADLDSATAAEQAVAPPAS